MSWKGMKKGRHRWSVSGTVLFIAAAIVLVSSCARLLQIWFTYRAAAREYDALRKRYTQVSGEDEPVAVESGSYRNEGIPGETNGAETTAGSEERESKGAAQETTQTGSVQNMEDGLAQEPSGATEITVVPDALPPSRTGIPEVPESPTAAPGGDVNESLDIHPPLQVNFDELRDLNPDIKAWIFISCLDLSYPVVQGNDNSWYLHRSAENSYSFAGSIFMDFRNKADFSDPNTILYGHNMKDGSMFGRLNEILTRQLYEKDSYFWVITPEGSSCYRIFSIFTSGTSGECFHIFDAAEKLADSIPAWSENMAACSEVKFKQEAFSRSDKIVTLATCTADSSTRLIVQGIRDHIHLEK